jgi:hypothetical protein
MTPRASSWLRAGLLAIALALLAASPAWAAVRPPSRVVSSGKNLSQSWVTDHFTVHYTTDATGDPSDAIGDADAQYLGNELEQAYSVYVGQWGYQPPRDDGAGDGRVDVYVWSDPNSEEANGTTYPDVGADQTSAWFSIVPSAIHNNTTAPHELFHVIQFGIYSRETVWFREATATWASARVSNSITNHHPWYHFPSYASNPLDCVPAAECGPDIVQRRWPFYEFLEEHAGAGFVRAILARSAAYSAAAGDHAAHDFQATDDLLHEAGSSFGQALEEFGQANLLGDYSFAPLAGYAANPPLTNVGVGAQTTAAQAITLNHLSIAYLHFHAAGCACVSTLQLAVTWPAGMTLHPRLVSDAPSDAKATLPASGPTSAAIVLPWGRAAHDARLAIANTTSADAVPISVQASVSQPPTPHLSAVHVRLSGHGRHRVLVVGVTADAAGTVDASVGGAHASFAIQPGANTLRVRVPARMRPGRAILSLVPRSPNGFAGPTTRTRARV